MDCYRGKVPAPRDNLRVIESVVSLGSRSTFGSFGTSESIRFSNGNVGPGKSVVSVPWRSYHRILFWILHYFSCIREHRMSVCESNLNSALYKLPRICEVFFGRPGGRFRSTFFGFGWFLRCLGPSDNRFTESFSHTILQLRAYSLQRSRRIYMFCIRQKNNTFKKATVHEELVARNPSEFSGLPYRHFTGSKGLGKIAYIQCCRWTRHDQCADKLPREET